MQMQSPLGSAFLVGSALFLAIALAGLAQAGEQSGEWRAEPQVCKPA